MAPATRYAEAQSELCMAVESIFSYAFLYRIHGDNSFEDKAELAAFNAFPAAMSPDWCSHQYVTQTNQIFSGNLTQNPFFNVVSYANTYGLEPNFPCYAVNHPQAYAKIPGWTTPRANIEKNGGRSKIVIPDDPGLHHIAILLGTTTLTLELPMEVRITMRNSSVSIYYGPLLYAFDISYTETHHQPLNWTDRKPLSDEEVHLKSHDYVLEPTELWQYAIDPHSIVVEKSTSTVGDLPNPIFAKDAPPVFLTVDAWKIAWLADNDTAAWPAIDPVVGKDKKEKIKLVPLGSGRLHIAQFPVAKPQ
nr:hypothetical protein FVER53263_05716 [Fusarium verticillioides]